jgi:hypothetical protein
LAQALPRTAALRHIAGDTSLSRQVTRQIPTGLHISF